jgi:hypothetical protein
MVWEKINVPPLSKILPFEEVPLYQKLMWGIIPLLSVIIAFILNIQMLLYQALKLKTITQPDFFKFTVAYKKFPGKLVTILHIWTAMVLLCIFYFVYQFYINNSSQLSPKNIVKAYYDAIDLKEFEKAHSYLDPKGNKSLSQFMLETAVQDGILNSYAKMDAIAIQIVKQTENSAKIIAKTKWVTPLEIIEKNYTHEVIKEKGKWYIVPNKIDLDIPPDQFLANNVTEYFKHGRRAVSTKMTYHDDVLKQPVLEILSAKLIQYNKQYIIIGEVQNVDNTPADVVLKATLYNRNDKILASFNSKYEIKHKLMPKEITSFKVNFEDIAWIKNTDIKSKTFNPNEFSSIEIKEKPVSFDIHCEGNVTINDLYTQVALSDFAIENNHIKGTLFNFGIQEITIPEILVSYYNDKKELIYVDHFFMREGIRVQRKNYFDYKLLNLTHCKILKSSLEKCFVNGMDNALISKAVVPNRKPNQNNEQLQKVKGNGFDYIKIEINNYIGNPR